MLILVNTVCFIYGRHEKLVFSTAYNLTELDLETGVERELVNHSKIVYSIAYDVKERYVYVPRYYENVIDRFPYPNYQTKNFEIVVPANSPYYVAFDSGNSHLYWTEHISVGRIMRCNSDGSEVTTIVNETQPVALALDTHNRWIYYSTESGFALHRVKYDGQEQQVVMNLLGRPIDIQIDFVDQLVYFMEYDTGDLKSTLYNGSDVKTVISTNVKHNNREIDIGGDYVFYTSNRKILKVHKSSGQVPTTLHTETAQIYGLLFYKQDGKNI